ncbi:protease pro-enzyme activation domain-containing protein [Streptomyces griseofuscus]|uniref:S53 family peptidase n=1 Tax=Streptomyces griseofuscus TaxID=146922 RepID=UPI0036A136A9
MRDRWWKSARLAGAIALPVITGTVVLAPGGLASLGAQSHEIPQSRPAWATVDADQGKADQNAKIEARVWLSGQDPEAASRYAEATSTPHNALYRHFLTPSEFQARFGPSPRQSQTVLTWARAHDLETTQVTAHFITIAGTVRQVEKALSVSFHSYSSHGRTGIAPTSTPSLPADLASAVLTITDLEHLTAAPEKAAPMPPAGNHLAQPQPCSTVDKEKLSDLTGADGHKLPWAPCGYTPQQLREAYGVNRPELTGQGATVAVVNAYTSPTISGDLGRYARQHGTPLRPGQYREVNSSTWDQTDICSPSTWYGEQTKDVEAVHAMAPEADIVYVGARNCTPSAFNDALLKVIDLHLADLVSCSWGETTDGYGLQQRLISHSVFEQGVIEGIGFYVASGDAGYEDPATAPGHASGSQRLQVDYPASDPLVTAVGGTSLMLDARGQYAYETGWGQYRTPAAPNGTTWKRTPPGDYPRDWAGGTGGGTSIMYEQPWYQAPVVPKTLSHSLPGGAVSPKAMRVVPDVALVADPLTGMLTGQTGTTGDGGAPTYSEGPTGGTSLSCPLFAGIQALLQQADGGKPLGFANPTLYRLDGAAGITDITDQPRGPSRPTAWITNLRDGSSDPPPPTYLATTGRNGEGPAQLRATGGFDNTTGLGTPNAAYITAYSTLSSGGGLDGSRRRLGAVLPVPRPAKG